MGVIRWKSENGLGLEHLVFDRDAAGVTADGTVIGERQGQAYGMRYRLRCAMDWTVREVAIDIVGGGKIRLEADGRGEWRDANGIIRADLAGCIDVDISATPFTNTLPIRRLRLAVGERRPIRVAYIAIPSLEVAAAEQAYTCLKPRERYRYEGIFRNFQAELDVDEDGLVRDYPSLFKRCAPGDGSAQV
ncbi:MULTISPECIES: putative glycolipid-binding domain-containing protein [unclassified Mesorhizobium]|uniref:putative glycolipid-binding domain-containing protein n=1 Tax=unclassified Mesorhizobium TaxID=325217 RepID=UPI0033369A7A